MRTEGLEYQRGVVDGFDFDAAYTVAGYRGIAWNVLGFAPAWEQATALDVDEDGNEVEVECDDGDWGMDMGRVVAVMVGDDRHFTFERDELAVLAREDYCGECGQVGCAHDGLARETA